MIDAAAGLVGVHGPEIVCQALDLDRASLYRGVAKLKSAARADNGADTVTEPIRIVEPIHRRARTSPRALSNAQEQEVFDLLHGERFVDKAPPQIYSTLLDEGKYLCSVSTMYRLLRRAGEARERRNQRRHPVYTKPELLATGPNQLWSWDITKLYGPQKWTYYYLYVIIDVFSRCVVGWTIAYRESAALAEELITQTCEKQRIDRGQLTIHADRGSAMTSKCVAFLLADLGVTKTHSRPHVSNDNPYSEAHFKTLKYRPDFPERFGCIEDARAHCHAFIGWYNKEHRHSGIGLLTPETVHYGHADQAIAQRQEVLAGAYRSHPERFVRKMPAPPVLPAAAWINRPKIDVQHEGNTTMTS